MSRSLTSTADSPALLTPTLQPSLGATAGLSSSASLSTNRPSGKRWNLRPPSDRDLQIYKMVKILRAEQWAVAGKFNLHESRVSQIIKNVHRWIAAGGSPTDPELRDHVSRQHVSRAAQRLRLLRAVEHATYALESDSRPLKTTRRRYVGGTEVWREETTHSTPEVSLPAVRVLLKAIQALQDFESQNDAEDHPSPNNEADDDTSLLPAVFSLLCTWRTRAEADGRLPAASDIQSLVASLLNNLLGTTLTRSASEGMPPPTALNLSADPNPPSAPNTDAPRLYEDHLSASPEKNVQL